jgi:hypothetical protein
MTNQSNSASPKYAGTTAKQISKWCDVSLKTAKLWKSGNRTPGPTAQNLINLHIHGRVMPQTGHWEPLRFERDQLTVNNGESFTGSEIAHMRTLVSISTATARENRDLQSKISQAEDYIQYLETMATRAPVIKIEAKKMRPSLSAPFLDNPYFRKSS